MVFADEESPVFLSGFFDIVAAGIRGEDKVTEAFRTGRGVGWHEQHRCLFCGTERFFRPGYRGSLVTEWIPALEGVQEKLERGAKVADIGCGHGASTHVLQTLATDGTWMIVEPFANDHLQDNLNPVGRVFYGASTVICTPASLSQEVGLALGAQAGQARLTDVLEQGGFTRVRRATETPFNLILEARP